MPAGGRVHSMCYKLRANDQGSAGLRVVRAVALGSQHLLFERGDLQHDRSPLSICRTRGAPSRDLSTLAEHGARQFCASSRHDHARRIAAFGGVLVTYA